MGFEESWRMFQIYAPLILTLSIVAVGLMVLFTKMQDRGLKEDLRKARETIDLQTEEMNILQRNLDELKSQQVWYQDQLNSRTVDIHLDEIVQAVTEKEGTALMYRLGQKVSSESAGEVAKAMSTILHKQTGTIQNINSEQKETKIRLKVN